MLVIAVCEQVVSTLFTLVTISSSASTSVTPVRQTSSSTCDTIGTPSSRRTIVEVDRKTTTPTIVISRPTRTWFGSVDTRDRCFRIVTPCFVTSTISPPTRRYEFATTLKFLISAPYRSTAERRQRN